MVSALDLQSVSALKKKHQNPILFAVGINHRSAPIELREHIYVHSHEIPQLIRKLKETLDEAVVVSTCNRTEIYGVTTNADVELEYYIDLLIEFKNADGVVSRSDFFKSIGCAACQQLFRVATSIDSKIVGDTQILEQVRDSYALAKTHKATGKITNQLFQQSFKIGKQTRTETTLHKGAISVSLAAVEYACNVFGTLENRKVLVIGAGDAARLTAESLAKRNIGEIIIANRTRLNAEMLFEDLKKAHEFEGAVIDFAAIPNVLENVDIVISSTGSPEPILCNSHFEHFRRKMLLIDLAVPRDIDPEVESRKNIELVNVDDLNAIIDGNYRRRMEDLPHANRIISDGMVDFLVWYYSLPLLPAELKCGAKPENGVQNEIVGVKKFLLDNLPQLHKLAMATGAETFSGHNEVIQKLVAMREASLAGRCPN